MAVFFYLRPCFPRINLSVTFHNVQELDCVFWVRVKNKKRLHHCVSYPQFATSMTNYLCHPFWRVWKLEVIKGCVLCCIKKPGAGKFLHIKRHFFESWRRFYWELMEISEEKSTWCWGDQVWHLTQFFQFPFCKKIIDFPGGKSITPCQGSTFLFSS